LAGVHAEDNFGAGTGVVGEGYAYGEYGLFVERWLACYGADAVGSEKLSHQLPSEVHCMDGLRFALAGTA
jgi:hypothetical protein